jgi:hypothetical protein
LNLALNKTHLDLQNHNFSEEFTQFMTSPFLKSSPEIIAETCLMALTGISYVLPRRADLVPIFEGVLDKNIDVILSSESLILKARMSLLLGYYADMLFKSNKEAFLKVMYFLVRSTMLTGNEKVVAL